MGIFKYLEAFITPDERVELDVTNHMNEEWKLSVVWKNMGVKVINEMYVRIFAPAVTYESELLGMKVRDRQKIDMFEMKCQEYGRCDYERS